MGTSSVRWLAVFLCGIGIMLGSCQFPVEGQRPPGGPPRPVHKAGEFDEFDENTDPLLSVTGVAGPIGILRTVGEGVYLNRMPQRGPMQIPNETFISTGPGSGARVDFFAANSGVCSVRVLSLGRGNVYGQTRSCNHLVETRTSVLILGEPGGTIYEISIIGGGTRVTVLSGVATVRLRSNGQDVRRVQMGQEIFISGQSIGEPTPLHHAITWRRNFDVVQAPGPSPVPPADTVHSPEPSAPDPTIERAAICRRYAATAVNQNMENLQRHCNFTGGRWQSNFNAHYSWCMSANDWRTAGPTEQNARAAQLRQCGQTPVIN